MNNGLVNEGENGIDSTTGKLLIVILPMATTHGLEDRESRPRKARTLRDLQTHIALIEL